MGKTHAIITPFSTFVNTFHGPIFLHLIFPFKVERDESLVCSITFGPYQIGLPSFHHIHGFLQLLVNLNIMIEMDIGFISLWGMHVVVSNKAHSPFLDCFSLSFRHLWRKLKFMVTILVLVPNFCKLGVCIRVPQGVCIFPFYTLFIKSRNVVGLNNESINMFQVLL